MVGPEGKNIGFQGSQTDGNDYFRPLTRQNLTLLRRQFEDTLGKSGLIMQKYYEKFTGYVLNFFQQRRQRRKGQEEEGNLTMGKFQSSSNRVYHYLEDGIGGGDGERDDKK